MIDVEKALLSGVEELAGPPHWEARPTIAFEKEPRDLSALSLCAPSMPPELLPRVLRPWLEDVCDRMRVPLEMVAVPAMVVAAALVGRRLTIRPKRRDDWAVVPNLWGCIVSRSGFLKSPALEEAMRPLRRIEGEIREKYEGERAEHENARRILELEISALEGRVKGAHKKGGGDIEQLAGILADKRRALEAAASVTEPRISTSDATVEKLGELLLHNPHGVALVRDELVGWLRTFDKPGRESDRQFYLEGWNGNSPHTVDRIGRGTLYIPAVCVSVIGGAQPGPLRACVRDAAADGAGADGLLQRVQLLVYPDEFPEWKNVDEWPNTEAKNSAYASIKHLASFEPAEIAERDGDSLPFLRFEPGAQAVFDAWRDELERRLRSGELASRPAFESHIAKYRSLMPALALLLHLLDGGASVREVSEAAARRAADWCGFLECHALKMYSEGGELLAARALADRIDNGEVRDGDTIRDVYRRGWAGLGTEERVANAARSLEGAGWLKIIPQKKPGQPGREPSPRIALHPSLMMEA